MNNTATAINSAMAWCFDVAIRSFPTEQRHLVGMLVALLGSDGVGKEHFRDVDAACSEQLGGITLTEMVKTRTTGDFQRFLLYLISP
eukprot:SAG31_NODE_15279_length_762_cov_2.518854_2_plen_86_part_01